MTISAKQIEVRNIPIENFILAPCRPNSAMPPISATLVERLIQDGAETIKARLRHGQYEIVWGERMWRAAQLAGVFTLPTWVDEYNDAQACRLLQQELSMPTYENVADEAQALQFLKETHGWTDGELADHLGRSRSEITHLRRLLKLDAEAWSLLESGRIQAGQAKVLVGLPPSQQRIFARRAQEGWSVRDLEEAARRLKQGHKAEQENQSSQTPSRRDPDIVRLEQTLTGILGSEVSIDGSDLIVHCGSTDVLDGVIECILSKGPGNECF